jgi:large subunit ribosomal protein L13
MKQKYATRAPTPRAVKKQTHREKAGDSLPTMIDRRGKTTILTSHGAIISRQWFQFDATGQTLGRFASEIAKILRGKHRVDYTENVDCGDGVVILNADKVKVTGMKHARKIYRKYTGFIGGLREVPYATMMARDPEFILEKAIKGMMPKTRLGDQQVKKLRIFKSVEANQSAPVDLTALLKAQKPTPVTITC